MKIFLIGFMGCGKTYWGHRVARHLNLPFFDLDQEIERTEQKTVNAIFDDNSEAYFRLREKEILLKIMEGNDSFVLATGGGTPCFHDNIECMKAAGIVVWLNCPVESIYARLARERAKRPLVKDRSEEELQSFIRTKIDERTPFYQQAHIIINAEEMHLHTLVSKIINS